MKVDENRSKNGIVILGNNQICILGVPLFLRIIIL